MCVFCIMNHLIFTTYRPSLAWPDHFLAQGVITCSISARFFPRETINAMRKIFSAYSSIDNIGRRILFIIPDDLWSDDSSKWSEIKFGDIYINLINFYKGAGVCRPTNL